MFGVGSVGNKTGGSLEFVEFEVRDGGVGVGIFADGAGDGVGGGEEGNDAELEEFALSVGNDPDNEGVEPVEFFVSDGLMGPDGVADEFVLLQKYS